MAPRKQEEPDDEMGEGSYVKAYQRHVPADFSAPRKAQAGVSAAPGAAAARGGVDADGGGAAAERAARRREELLQRRAARQAATASQNGDSWASAAFASATSRPASPEPGRAEPAPASGPSGGEAKEDLSKLSVKELKARIKACGCTIPPTITEKEELVAMLQIFSKAAAKATTAKEDNTAAPRMEKEKEKEKEREKEKEEPPPPAARTRARSRGAFSARAEREEATSRPSPDAKACPGARPSEAMPPSTPPRSFEPPSREEPSPPAAASSGRARRGFAQWSGDAPPGGDSSASAPTSSAPSGAGAVSEEDLAKLSIKEMKRQLKDLNVDIPASYCEKEQIVGLLARSLRSRGGGAPARQDFPESSPPQRQSYADTEEVRRREREEEDRRARQEQEERRRQEQEERRARREREEEEEERRAAREREEKKRLEEQQRRLEQRRQQDQKRAAEEEERRRRLQEAEADEDVAPPPPPPPPPEDISTLSVKELKARIKEAGVPVPSTIVEKRDLVNILRKALARKAATEASQAQQAEARRQRAAQSAQTSQQSGRPSKGGGPQDQTLRPCRHRCGFAVTWGTDRCCNACPKHGPKCDRKPMPDDWDGSVPSFGGPLPNASGEADPYDSLSRLNLLQLKKKCGAAGVVVPRNADKEELIQRLQDEQRRRRCLRLPGAAEKEKAERDGDMGGDDDGPVEDFGKMTVRDIKQKIVQLGARVPANITEKRDLIDVYKRAKRTGRLPTCNSKTKFLGANKSYDRRRTDDARPWFSLDGCFCGPKRGAEQVPPAGPPLEEDEDGLWQTFGYVAGMEVPAPYARFDIREDICLRYGGFKHASLIKDRAKGELAIVIGVKRCQGRPVLWVHPKGKSEPCSYFYTGCNAARMKQLWEQVGEEDLDEVHPMDTDIVEDSDEEMWRLCTRCKLPVGELAFVNSESDAAQHAECITKRMVEVTKVQDDERLEEDWERTWTHRKDYNIGWVPKIMIPVNEELALRLTNEGYNGPMISLLLSADRPPTMSLTVATEPNCSVNLNYLITALRVLQQTDREPVFSLDPCPPWDDMRNGWQNKRFEPTLLNGSKAGEVLFQADYHLKELSMGEYDQAVNGMKNAMDWSEDTNYWDWRAREWFICQNAVVERSKDGVLMPQLELAVKAKQQVVDPKTNQLVDVVVDDTDHPLVKYGIDFSHYMDLICERLSVVFHLREYFKAQIVARFIYDSGAKLDSSWIKALPKDVMGELKMPQHRREIGRLHLRVANGEYFTEPDQELGLNIWGVYGGVDMNLNDFDLSEAKENDKEVLPGEPVDLESLSEEELRDLIIQHGGTIPPGITDKPDLIDIMREIIELEQDFWGMISGSGPSCYSPDEQSLLRKIFNPHLSDRRLDKDRFIWPTRDPDYMNKLRRLIQEETAIQEKRKKAFCMPDFAPGQHSPPFPYCWRSKFAVAVDTFKPRALGELTAGRLLTKVPISSVNAGTLQSMTKIFDGQTEDGTNYRIYQGGKQEVRTIQEHDQEEEVVVAFSSERAQVSGDTEGRIAGRDAVAQVTFCVGVGGEGPVSRLDSPEQEVEGSCEAMPHYRFFVVIETRSARANHHIVTEMLSDGAVTWEEDPQDMEHRRSRAGMLNHVTCKSLNLQQLKDYRKRYVGKYHPFASASACKQYAQGIFRRAKGEIES